MRQLSMRMIVAAGTVMGGCGTGDDSKGSLEVTDFWASDCKTGGPSQPIDLGSRRCVAWAADSDGTLAVQLTGFMELCATPTLWKARSQAISPERLGIWVEWAFKNPTACGYCERDFTFRIHGAQMERFRMLEIATRGCTANTASCAWSRYESDLTAVDAGAANLLCGDAVRRL